MLHMIKMVSTGLMVSESMRVICDITIYSRLVISNNDNSNWCLHVSSFFLELLLPKTKSSGPLGFDNNDR